MSVFFLAMCFSAMVRIFYSKVFSHKFKMSDVFVYDEFEEEI
jgi:hypothetical protein